MRPAPGIQRRNFLARALAAVAGVWAGGKGVPRAEAGFNDAPYYGEIRMFAGNFAPLGWAFCDGQLLSIDDNSALYSLLGTYYGGDGQTTFALPDLRSRAPVHVGPATSLGQPGGQEYVSLSQAEMPAHSHALYGTTNLAEINDPMGRVPARNPLGWPHYNSGIDAAFAPDALTPAGFSIQHNNMMPSLTVSFIICIDGVYPQRP